MNLQKGFFKKVIVGLAIFLLFVIIIFTSGSPRDASVVEDKTGGVLVTVQSFFKNMSQSVSDALHTVGSISYIKKENETLKKEIAFLEEENRLIKDIISKKDYLKREYELTKTSENNYIDAEVVGKDPGNWFNNFTINKGSQDGVLLNDMVVLPVQYDEKLVIEGLVGRVVEIGDNWSRVIAVVDYGSSVSFRVVRTEDQGILSGSLEKTISGYLFDSEADIVVGDKLVTSGTGGVFRKNIYIGEIAEISKSDDSLIKSVKVKPQIDFKKISKVIVLHDDGE
ncbi:MAG: rod shape-determining protein MreC [Tissierellales bacterium]|jgi:rod shape-determining protein MreC|nr:rod shape-determining protein MreC [Tissierellales bacterium]